MYIYIYVYTYINMYIYIYMVVGVMFWILTLAHLNGSVRRASHATSAARHKVISTQLHFNGKL